MDYIWIILAALSAIIIAIYSKKVDKAQHPNAYKKEGKKGKKAKKAKKAKKPLRENRMLEFSMAGLFIGIVASTIMPDNIALLISGCFFAGLVLGMIFRKKTYVESLDELDIEEDSEPAPVVEEAFEEAATEEAADLEAEIITAE